MKIVSNQGTVVVTASEKAKEQLPQTVEVLESELAAMTFESMVDKTKVAGLEETSATLAFEIMQLKTGGN